MTSIDNYSAIDVEIGRLLGWIRYPSDSLERGNVWHTDPARAPFGPTISVNYFRPTSDNDDFHFVMNRFGVEVKKLAEGSWRAICNGAVTIHEDLRVAVCLSIIAGVKREAA